MAVRRTTHPTRSVSLRIRVCHSNTRIVVRLLGPCFKTGRLRPFRRREPCGPTCLLSQDVSLTDYKAATRRWSHLSTSLFHLVKRSVDLPSAQTAVPQRASSRTADITGLNRFPFNNFTYYLTLFSKFFSSFPHGTCSLSVSCHYLALDEMYHPFWTAFPNNPTLGAAFVLDGPSDDPDGNFTLFVVPFQRTLTIHRSPKGDPLNYNSDTHPDARF